MPDIVITPNRGTSNNPKIDFTGTSAGTIKLEVLADGSIAWNGANGSLFSIADSLSGSLMSVNDISGLPAFEVFSDNRVVVGQFGANLLLGKTTSSSNGRLQLANHTTVAGGIGIGTDINLYRSAAGSLSIASSANPTQLKVSTTTAGGYSQIYLSNPTRDFILTNNAGDSLLSFNYSGANRLQFDTSNQWFNSGNVGIGTTSPSQKLEVNGNASIINAIAANVGEDGSSFNSGISMWGSPNSTTSLSMFKSWASIFGRTNTLLTESNGYATYHIMDTSGRGWVWRYATGGSAGTNVASLRNDTGQLSLGTSWDWSGGYHAQLNIAAGQGSATTYRDIDMHGSWAAGEGHAITATHAGGASNIVGQIVFQHDGPGSRIKFGRLYHSGDQSGYPLELISTGANVANLILNNGNVGLGVTSPSHKLHFEAGSFIGLPPSFSYVPSSWTRGSSGIIMAGSNNADGSGWSYGGRIVEVDEGDGLNIAFDVNYTNSWTNNAMVISGRAGKLGNVGIGTISPSYRLHVEGDSYSSTGFYVRNSAATFIGSVNNMSGISVNGTSYDTFIVSGGNQTITVKSGGNVGINQTAPSYKLDVNGSLNSTSYYTSGTAGYIYKKYTFDLSAQSSTQFFPIRFTNTPNLAGGIHDFEVVMDSFGGGDPYNHHSVLGKARGSGWTDLPSFFDIFHNCYDNAERSYLGLYKGTQSCTDLILYVRGGKIYYVKTPSDASVSTSALSISDSVFAIKNSSGADASGTSANISFMINLLTANQGRMISHTTSVAALGVNTQTPAYAADVSGNLRSTTDAHFATSSGSVGIGNTSPSYKLHVSGDIYANGGWFRVSSSSGIYWETYGGGWYMNDSTWLRAYNDKAIITNNEIRGTIFVDANDTGYYVNPATGTNLNGTLVNNGGTAMTAGWNRNLLLSSTFPVIVFNSNSTKYSGIGVDYSNTAAGMYFWVNGSSADISGTATVALGLNTGNYVTAYGSFRAPVFYDSNDTAYYTDPASTSILSKLSVGNAPYVAALQAGALELGRTDTNYQYISGWTGTMQGGILANCADNWEFVIHDSGHRLASAFEFRGSGTNVIRLGRDLGWGVTPIETPGNLTIIGNAYAPVYYDYNDTNYYVDPASTSRVNTISFVSGASFGPYLQFNNQSNLRLQAGQQSGAIGISGYDFNGNWKFQLYGDSSGYGFLNGNWAGWDLLKSVSGNLYLNNQSTYYIGTSEIYYNRVYGLADIRSPIFYDNDNTGYYIDGNSTSYLNSLYLYGGLTTTGNTRLGQSSGTTTRIDDILQVGASDSGDSHLYFGEDTSSWYGAHWYWDSGYTHYWYSRNGGTDSTLMQYATNDTTKITFGRNIEFNNYGKGIIGTYASTRYQGVFAMGESYKLPDDGTGVGSLYGIAWSHPNAGGVAANLASHGMLILESGLFRGAWGGGRLVTTSDIRGTVFYDYDNTGYYVDPTGNANIANSVYVGGWFRNYGNQGLYNETHGNHWYATGNDYWNLAGNNASNIGIILRSGGHQGTIRGYVYADSNNHIGFLNNGGSWRLRVVSGDYTLAEGSSIRGQLFYDSNDTNYYVDPASTSVLNIIQPNYNNGAIGPSGTTAPTNGHNDVTHSVKYLDGYGAAVPNGVEGSWWQGSVAIGNATRGFQLAGGYSVQSLWYRRGADGWQSWVRCLNTSVDPYASNMNQYVRSSDNVQFNSIGVAIAASGTAGSISLNQSGTRSWTITPTGGNLAFASGDGLGAITYGGSIRATSFFDISNTSYYVDPASTSVLNSATFASDITVGNGASNSYIYMADSDEGTRAIHCNSNRIGFLNQSSGWGSYCEDSGFWQSEYSIRGPVFYDSNDTTYYVDPNNTAPASSNLRGRIHISGGHYHSSLRVFLPSSENGAATGTVSLQMWCSEPGNTWDGAGFGYNVDHTENNGGSAPAYYFGRVNTSLGQSYMRFLSGGDWYLYNTTTGGTRTLSLGVGSDGIFYAYNHIRTPYIYDSNNTAYYFDGNNTSVMNLVTVNSLGVGTSASGTTGEIRATNNITAYYSDERLKTKLGKIEDPIAKVKSLSGFYFEANETAVALGYDKKREVGVSAQEVQAVLPEIIAPAPISDKYMTVRYEKLIPLLIEAIKEQQNQIEQLSNELKSLKNKL